MLDDQLRTWIGTTSEILGLEDAVIEKDYYVTQIIHALSGTENDCFRLVFSGGTCLAKAHKIVKRMSEDVDFKIHIKKVDGSFNKTRFLKELKQFRALILSKLSIPGLTVGQPIVLNEGQYSRIEVNYPSIFPESIRLRPHVLLEFTLSDIHLSIENLCIKTLIEVTLKNVELFAQLLTKCVSVNETAIEKWVGLTRRIVAIERAYHNDDKTLIRHVYDLSAIKNSDRIQPDFFVLAKSIVTHDANKFKNQHPEYSADPVSEIKRSLALLKDKPIWKERYQEFIDTMVYDDTSAIDYKSAIETLEHISERVMVSLCQEMA